MSNVSKFAALAALLLLATPAIAQQGPPPGGGGLGGPGGPPPGGPGGPRPKPMKPVKRERFDKAVTALFHDGDADRNGYITLAELRATIDARRDRLVQARFERLDTDRNGSLSPAEFSAWQRGMGSVALSENQGSPRDTEIVPAEIRPDVSDDPDDMVLRMLVEPLGATVVTNADGDHDGNLSLAELLAYQGARFERADADKDSAISPDELRSLEPNRGPRRDGPPGERGPGRP